jgi:hypothetical protein
MLSEVCKEAELGETETVIGEDWAMIVIWAEAALVVSLTDVALRITVAGLGTVEGAV